MNKLDCWSKLELAKMSIVSGNLLLFITQFVFAFSVCFVIE